jgi:hypothetical protein
LACGNIHRAGHTPGQPIRNALIVVIVVVLREDVVVVPGGIVIVAQVVIVTRVSATTGTKNPKAQYEGQKE